MFRKSASAARRQPARAGGSIFSILAAAGLAAACVNHIVGRRTERRHPPEGRFIEVKGVRLHYRDSGPRAGGGATIVLLHGNGASSEDFVASSLFDLLAAEHRVIAFDRPGSGYSERPRRVIWTAQAQAALLAKALEQIGVERPVVVGHSWGTLVALAMALDVPGNVAGLALLAGYYFPTTRADVLLFSPPAIPVLGDILRYTISPPLGWLLAPVLIRKIFAPSAVPASFGAFPVSMSLRPSQLRATAGDTALMIPAAAALSSRYADLKMPVAILAGTGDEIVKVAQSERLQREIPGSELRLIEGAGHMIHYLEPRTVAAAIDAVARRSEPVRQVP